MGTFFIFLSVFHKSGRARVQECALVRVRMRICAAEMRVKNTLLKYKIAKIKRDYLTNGRSGVIIL